MTMRTYERDGLTRETELPTEAVALLCQGWEEITPGGKGKAQAKKEGK